MLAACGEEGAVSESLPKSPSEPASEYESFPESTPEPFEPTAGLAPAIDEATIRLYYDTTYNAMVTGYYHDDLGYITETVSGENWLMDAIQLVYSHTGIQFQKMWYDGNRLYADLVSQEFFRFQGSAGASIRYNIMYTTLASFPGVEEIVVLIGGERDAASDHFCFAGVAIVTGLNSDMIWQRLDDQFATGRLGWVQTECRFFGEDIDFPS